MTDARREQGSFGESLAARVLSDKGMRIVARGYRTRFGEVDLIVAEQGRLRFVEVKTRRSDAFGPPEEAVTRAKLRKIAAVAAQFLSERGWQHLAFQIDVVAIRLMADGPPEIVHFENVGE